MKNQIVYSIDTNLFILFKAEIKPEKERVERFLNRVVKNSGMVVEARKKQRFLKRDSILLKALIPFKNAVNFSNDLSQAE